MTATEQLELVKSSLMVTGNHLDGALKIWLDDVKYYMGDAGVHPTVIDSEVAMGAICRGVSDLWTTGVLSAYFYQRVSQLVYEDVDTDSDVITTAGSTITSAELLLDGNDEVRSGAITMSDGTSIPIDIKYLPALTITATPVDYDDFTTTVTITPELGEGNRYIYKLSNGKLPAPNEVVSDIDRWVEWNGVDAIDTEGTTPIYFLEVNSDNVAIRGGVIDVEMEF